MPSIKIFKGLITAGVYPNLKGFSNRFARSITIF